MKTKNIIHIFGLAISLVLLAGCGEKNDNLPATSKNVSKEISHSTEKKAELPDSSEEKSNSENNDYRPVIVTVLESGCFSPGARKFMFRKN